MAPPELDISFIGLRIASIPSRVFGVLSARTGTVCDFNMYAGRTLNMHPQVCQSLLISSQPMPPICAASGLMPAVQPQRSNCLSGSCYCLQWHVTPRALEQWQKYKAMIHEDAARKQQPAEHSRQGPSHEKSTTPAAPQAQDAQQTDATHSSEFLQTAAANPARQRSSSPPKTKQQRLSPDMQQDRQPQQQQQQQQQQRQATQSGVAQSGTGVHQQPCNLADEHASHLNDTVGAVYVDAAGQTILPRLCQPLPACQ